VGRHWCDSRPGSSTGSCVGRRSSSSLIAASSLSLRGHRSRWRNRRGRRCR
jgi:hypothetical protein